MAKVTLWVDVVRTAVETDDERITFQRVMDLAFLPPIGTVFTIVGEETEVHGINVRHDATFWVWLEPLEIEEDGDLGQLAEVMTDEGWNIVSEEDN